MLRPDVVGDMLVQLEATQAEHLSMVESGSSARSAGFCPLAFESMLPSLGGLVRGAFRSSGEGGAEDLSQDLGATAKSRCRMSEFIGVEFYKPGIERVG